MGDFFRPRGLITKINPGLLIEEDSVRPASSLPDNYLIFSTSCG